MISKRALGSLVTIVLVIAAFGALYVTARFFREREEDVRSENPIVFCPPAGRQDAPDAPRPCFFTTHTHLYPSIRVFGQNRPLPFEKGLLSGHHTHAQRDKIHWHALVEVDPATKEVPEGTFTLGKVFDDLGIPFAADRIFDHRVGETNPQTGQPAALTVRINGTPVDVAAVRETVWQDGDRVEVHLE